MSETATSVREPETITKLEIDWVNCIFLGTVTLGMLWGVLSYALQPELLDLRTVLLAGAMFFLTGLSITIGYHRTWSHQALKCAWPVRLFFAIFGAGAIVGSILIWGRNHVDHHDDTDGPLDRYSRRRGFWWAHVGALFYKDTLPDEYSRVEFLKKDPIVVWQHKYFVWIAGTVAILLPCLIASLWGDVVGALKLAVFIRIWGELQAIFFVNSGAHTWGRRTFNAMASAADNIIANAVLTVAFIGFAIAGIFGYWTLSIIGMLSVCALATCGEDLGHGYHHTYPGDYRNYPRWWYLDPSRWVINLLRLFGLAWGVHPPSREQIRAAQARAQAAAGLNQER